jgi:hypothetical protein
LRLYRGVVCLSGQVEVGWERFVRKFIEEDEASKTFYVVVVGGRRRPLQGWRGHSD